MNILMVLEQEYPPDIRVEKEIQTLASVGYNVHIACITQKDRELTEQTSSCTIFRKPITNVRRKTSVGALKFPFYFNFWRSFLSTLLGKHKYDVIHIHDLPLARVGYDLSRKYKIKFVLDLHENWPVLMDLSTHTKSILGRLLHSNNQWLKYEKKYASLADALIVVADEMAERLLKNGVKNNNIITVANTTETDIFNGLENIIPNPQYFTLIYTGGLNKHRGLELILEGLSKMKLDENFRFWIVGKGRNESYLKEMVKKLHLSKYVNFLGWKPQQEVFKLILKSDITLIPHLKTEHSDNTSPNKIFHYMLAQKPILASNCNYIQNIITKTNCGEIFENGNDGDFANKLNFIMKNPSKWKVWGKNGYKAVQQEYNWKITSRSLISLYNTLRHGY